MNRVEPDGRKRQAKRDEHIRRKLELELSKRKSKVGLNGAASASQYEITEGSVMALKPLPPLSMPLNTTVMDAAQYMTAFRASCVLVLDDEDAVCGIFTAKDLAFKVVAATGRDMRRSLTIADIMTPGPACVDIDSSATNALNLMVSRGFRHLPIMDKNGEIAGVLDITRCFFEAMRKLERACVSSQRLQDALQNVQSEFGAGQPAKFMNYVQKLKDQTEGPDLRSVIDGMSRSPVYIDAKSSASEAALLMKQNHTTSILVMDRSAITGICTTKDIVLRVLAAGLDPQRCSVVRVMTPNPDCAYATMSVRDALRKMHDGKYLNLPVKNEDEEIIGVVDVLQLTYSTLEQINNITAMDSAAEGPAWNKFWMSLDDGTESEGQSKVHPYGFEDLETNSSVNVSENELAQFSIPEGLENEETADPDDSTYSGQLVPSAEPAERSALNEGEDVMPEDSMSRLGLSANAAEVPDEKPSFSFKFRAPSSRAHRIQVSDTASLDEFRELILAKLSEADLESLGGASKFAVSYLDDDKDIISITTQHDIREAVQTAKKAGSKRAEIYLHHVDQTPVLRTTKNAAHEPAMMPMLMGSAAAVVFGLLAWGRK